MEAEILRRKRLVVLDLAMMVAGTKYRGQFEERLKGILKELSENPDIIGFIDEIQLQCWVMSHDGQNDADVLACCGASAALGLTDAPFEGPVGLSGVGERVRVEVIAIATVRLQSEFEAPRSAHCTNRSTNFSSKRIRRTLS